VKDHFISTILHENESDQLELERRADGRSGELRRDIGCDQHNRHIVPVHLYARSGDMS
jgi:hypothetical protein